MNVRQPLALLEFSGMDLASTDREKYLALAKDELNVKDISSGQNVKETHAGDSSWVVKENGGLSVALSLQLDDALVKEGIMREIVRNVQDLRKKSGLNPGDSISLSVVSTADGLAVVNSFLDDIKRLTGSTEISLTEGTEGRVKINDFPFAFEINV
jgi:hypothetical protein